MKKKITILLINLCFFMGLLVTPVFAEEMATFVYEGYTFRPNSDGITVTLISSPDVENGAKIIVPDIVKDENGIEYSVTVIGEEAFKNSGAEEIVIPSTVSKFETGAFADSDVKILDVSETTIKTFGGNSSNHPFGNFTEGRTQTKHIEQIILPSTFSLVTEYSGGYVDRVQIQIFSALSEWNDNINNVILTIDSENYVVDENFIYNKEKTEVIYYNANPTQGATVEIPDGVKSICMSAFAHCKGIVEVTIPDSVTTIEAFAFEGCTDLEKVNFSEKSNLELIKRGVFTGCGSLTDFIAPENLTIEGGYAGQQFKDTGLKKMYLPENVKLSDNPYGVVENTTIKIYYVNPALQFSNSFLTGSTATLFCTNGGKLVRNTWPNNPEFEKEGYEFDGWYDNKGLTGNAVNSFNSGKNYYAKWTIDTENYAYVNYSDGVNANNDTEKEIVKKYNEYTLKANGFERNGYSFAGWKIGDTTYNEGDSVQITGETTITAVWSFNKPTVSVTTGPSSKIYDGSSIIITAVHEAAGDKTYQWYKYDENSGKSALPGEINDTLALTNVIESGKYCCYVTVGDIGDYSNDVEVVITPIEITVSPIQQSISMNGAFDTTLSSINILSPSTLTDSLKQTVFANISLTITGAEGAVDTSKPGIYTITLVKENTFDTNDILTNCNVNLDATARAIVKAKPVVSINLTKTVYEYTGNQVELEGLSSSVTGFEGFNGIEDATLGEVKYKYDNSVTVPSAAKEDAYILTAAIKGNLYYEDAVSEGIEFYINRAALEIRPKTLIVGMGDSLPVITANDFDYIGTYVPTEQDFYSISQFLGEKIKNMEDLIATAMGYQLIKVSITDQEGNAVETTNNTGEYRIKFAAVPEHANNVSYAVDNVALTLSDGVLKILPRPTIVLENIEKEFTGRPIVYDGIPTIIGIQGKPAPTGDVTYEIYTYENGDYIEEYYVADPGQYYVRAVVAADDNYAEGQSDYIQALDVLPAKIILTAVDQEIILGEQPVLDYSKVNLTVSEDMHEDILTQLDGVLNQIVGTSAFIPMEVPDYENAGKYEINISVDMDALVNYNSAAAYFDIHTENGNLYVLKNPAFEIALDEEKDIVPEADGFKVIFSVTNSNLSAGEEPNVIVKDGNNNSFEVTKNNERYIIYLPDSECEYTIIASYNKNLEKFYSAYETTKTFAISERGFADISLTADYTEFIGAKTITLTLDRGNIGVSDTVVVSCDDNTIELIDNKDGTYSVALPSIPKEYTFTAVFEGNQLFKPNTESIRCKVIANTYTVQFDANGGSSTMSALSFAYGETKQLPANEFVYANKHFTGWNTKADGSGTSYANGQDVSNLTTENNGVITLYAQWADKPALTGFIDTSNRSAVYGAGVLDAREVTTSSAITYSSSNPDVATVDEDGNITVLNAGETDITATVQETEENAESAASYKLIVAPKTLTITADSFEVTVGSTQPELTYEVEGLVDGDSLIDNPSCTTDANMGIAGTYNIIPSGANAGSNYTISYVNGTLKVIAIVQPPSGNGPSYIPSTTPKDEPKDEPKEDSHDAVMDEVIACTEDSSCPIGEYIDIPEDAWYHDGVHYCIERNIMGGYGNGIFKPNAAVSRAMISAMLWNLEGSPVVNYALQYKDVPSDAWYTEAVRWMVAEGLAGGYGNGIYAPEDELTREQLAAILQKYAQYKGYDMTKGATVNLQSYGDVQDISAWAGEAMQWICDNGIVGGMPGKNGNLVLNPTGQATRAQVATMLMTFCENMEK